MNPLRLSVAIGDYDRTRALLNGSVRIDGVEPVYMTLSPEEMFFRAFRNAEFDLSELSLSSYLVEKSSGRCPFIAVPVFLSRAFRHSAIYVRTDRIKEPEDLRGRRIGIPEYQLTAIVWARAMLQDDYGIHPEDVFWVRGGIVSPGRPEKIKLRLASRVQIEDAPADDTISAMLDRGDIDAFIAPRPPSGNAAKNPRIGWLFTDPVAAAKDYFRRTGVFPIMHVLGVRQSLVAKHPWLPTAVLKAFEKAKQMALEALTDTSAIKVTLPFAEFQLKEARELMGEDFWPYGVAANLKTLDTFLHHHHSQGLSAQLMTVEELFHPATYETYKV